MNPGQFLLALRADPLGVLETNRVKVDDTKDPRDNGAGTYLCALGYEPQYVIEGIIINPMPAFTLISGDAQYVPKPDRAYVDAYNVPMVNVSTLPGYPFAAPGPIVIPNATAIPITPLLDQPRLISTYLLSGCTICYQVVGHTLYMAHIQPDNSSDPPNEDLVYGRLLQKVLHTRGEFEGLGGVGFKTYGKNDFANKESEVQVLGIAQDNSSFVLYFQEAYTLDLGNYQFALVAGVIPLD